MGIDLAGIQCSGTVGPRSNVLFYGGNEMKENNRKWNAKTEQRRAELDRMKDPDLHDLANALRPTPIESSQYVRKDAIDLILATEGLLGREVSNGR